MAKSKKKTDSVDLFAVPKSAQEIKMENAQDLYNYLFEACNIIRGPVCIFLPHLHLFFLLSSSCRRLLTRNLFSLSFLFLCGTRFSCNLVTHLGTGLVTHLVTHLSKIVLSAFFADITHAHRLNIFRLVLRLAK